MAEKHYTRRDFRKKAGLTLKATSPLLNLASCVTTKTISINPKQASNLYNSTPHTLYINKEENLALADPNGGLEFRATYGWKKASLEEIDFSKYTKRDKFTMKDSDKNTNTYEAILFSKNDDFDETAYNFNNNIKKNEFWVTKEERNEGGGGGGCFTPNTPVLLSSGETKPIKEITIGDTVKSFDFQTKQATNYKASGLSNYLKNTKTGKYVTGGVTGLALLTMVGCSTIGTVNGVNIHPDRITEQSSEEKGNKLTEWVKEHPYLTILGGVIAAGAIYSLANSGGSDSDDDYVAPPKEEDGGVE